VFLGILILLCCLGFRPVRKDGFSHIFDKKVTLQTLPEQTTANASITEMCQNNNTLDDEIARLRKEIEKRKLEKGKTKMKYYLKNIGDSQVEETADFIRQHEEGQKDKKLWDDIYRCRFNKFPAETGDIVIIYTILGDKSNYGAYGGRIWGYYKVISVYKDEKVLRWGKYVELKNLCKSFSIKSKDKDKEILNLTQFEHDRVRCGYMELDETTAQKIIKEIENNK
jgi:hypothetical protein